MGARVVGQPIRVVHYLNQFFGGAGGETMAGVRPTVRDGAVGPGRLLQESGAGQIEVVATVICGDNYFVEHQDTAVAEIVGLVRRYAPQGLVAGPAFAAGRYGEAVAEVVSAVQSQLGIPAVTGLAPESPALERYRRTIPIVRTASTAAGMKESMPRMGTVLVRMVRGESLAEPEQAWLYPRGRKQNTLHDRNAAERAIDMLLAKVHGRPWRTEVAMLRHESVPPAPPAPGGRLRLALVTDGGLIRKGNPDGMVSGRSVRWCRIDAGGWDRLTPEQVEALHYGYDTRDVLADPNRLVPLDVVRELEQAGQVELHPIIYSTSGAGTSIQNALRFGREIAAELLAAGVQAAILTST